VLVKGTPILFWQVRWQRPNCISGLDMSEAGLRSYDRTMPEELNRIITDHISDHLFAPTINARAHPPSEGIAQERVFVTGNTIVDSVHQNMQIAWRKSAILKNFELEASKYFLVTAHRQENVDREDKLKGILDGIRLVAEKYKISLIYPIHPRTKRRIEEFRLTVPARVILVEPLGYLDFLALEDKAALVLTDSGGVQEETCILRVPCVTLRENTERPETLEVGGNLLAGTNSEMILNCVDRMLSAKKDWPNPFGDGHSGARIAEIIGGTPKTEALI